MKKKIFGIAIAAVALMTSASAFAQKPTQCKKEECKKEIVCKKDTCTTCKNDTCTTCKKDRHCRNPFEGITLTPEQQKQLDAIRPQRPQKGDRQAQGADRQARREARQQYFDQVKTILTPEQYEQFMKNIKKDRPHKKGKKFDGKRQGSPRADRRN